jgi:hypothetical protein
VFHRGWRRYSEKAHRQECLCHPPPVLRKTVIIKGLKVPLFSRSFGSVHSERVEGGFCWLDGYAPVHRVGMPFRFSWWLTKRDLMACANSTSVTIRVTVRPRKARVNGGGGRFWYSPGTLAAWKGVSARFSVLLHKALEAMLERTAVAV